MRNLLNLYSRSVMHFSGVLPVLGALLSIKPENTSIATSIPGLGACRSTYCKPERRDLGRLAH